MSALNEIMKAITPGGRIGDDSSLDRSPGVNWVERAGGLPKYIRMVAHAFLRKGKDMSGAIRMAVGVVRNWAEGKGNVTPKVQAAAAAAIAEWEAKAKGNVGKSLLDGFVDDDEFEEITKALVCKHNIAVMKTGCPLCQHQRAYDPSDERVKADLRGKKKKRKVKKRFVSMDERKGSKTPTYPGTTKFPVKNQADFDNAWGLRGSSSIPKDKVESWLRGLAKRKGYSCPGETSKKFTISMAEFKKLEEEINTDAAAPDEFFSEGEIEKKDDEKQLVFGWCSIAKQKDGTVVVDKQGDVLEDIDQMEKVAYDFVLHSRDGGEMHVRKGVSTLVESFVSTPEKWEAMGIPEGTLPIGWWVGFHVKDKGVWDKVKKKQYKMFSVHGSGLRKALDE